MRHIKIINRTLAQFDQIVTQLEKSEAALQTEIDLRITEIANMTTAQVRAETARTNIQKITGA